MLLLQTNKHLTVACVCSHLDSRISCDKSFGPKLKLDYFRLVNIVKLEVGLKLASEGECKVIWTRKAKASAASRSILQDFLGSVKALAWLELECDI